MMIIKLLHPILVLINLFSVGDQSGIRPGTSFTIPILEDADEGGYHSPALRSKYNFGDIKSKNPQGAHDLSSITSTSTPPPQIIKFYKIDQTTGTYSFEVESSDGSTHSENGTLKGHQHVGGGHDVKTGTYTFKDSEGLIHRVTYTADENGFRVTRSEEDQAI